MAKSHTRISEGPPDALVRSHDLFVLPSAGCHQLANRTGCMLDKEPRLLYEVNDSPRIGRDLGRIVSDLREASLGGDTAEVRAGLTRMFACLKQLESALIGSGLSRESLAAAWLLMKCAETLRDLEWQTTSRLDEFRRTVDLADKCIAQLGEVSQSELDSPAARLQLPCTPTGRVLPRRGASFTNHRDGRSLEW